MPNLSSNLKFQAYKLEMFSLMLSYKSIQQTALRTVFVIQTEDRFACYLHVINRLKESSEPPTTRNAISPVKIVMT